MSRPVPLTVLLDLYGAGDEEHEVLEELRREASKRGWWSTYRLPSWLQPYVGMETDATTMRSFESELIPGLLQTEEYSRRLHGVAAHLVKSEEVDKLVAARMRRQSRLTDDEAPLDLSTVVSEAAFRRARSGAANACEVADLGHGPRAVRDSKDPDGPVLRFTPVEWVAFTAGVRAGEFD